MKDTKLIRRCLVHPERRLASDRSNVPFTLLGGALFPGIIYRMVFGVKTRSDREEISLMFPSRSVASPPPFHPIARRRARRIVCRHRRRVSSATGRGERVSSHTSRPRPRTARFSATRSNGLYR